MTQAKWFKVGAAAILSVSMLSACGSDEPEDNEVVPGDTEQEENVERNQDSENGEPDSEEESDTEAEIDAETDGEEYEFDSEEDAED